MVGQVEDERGQERDQKAGDDQVAREEQGLSAGVREKKQQDIMGENKPIKQLKFDFFIVL